MRLGPDEKLLSRSDVAVGWEVNIVRGRQTLATNVPVRGVVVDATSDRVIPQQISYLLPSSWSPRDPADAAQNKGQTSQLTALLRIAGVDYRVEIGWYKHVSWEETSGGIKVVAQDLMLLLDEDPFTWPSSPPQRATFFSELQRLAGDHLPVKLDSPDFKIGTSFQWGHSRTEAIRDLAAAYGMEYAVKPDGYLHAWKIRDARVTAATYTAKDLLLEGLKKSGPRRPNYFTAFGVDESDKEKGIRRWAATARAVGGLDPALYGIKREVSQVDSATSQRQVTQAANRLAAEAGIVVEERSLEVGFDPRLELGDVCGFIVDDADVFAGRVKAYSMGDADQTMRVDVEVLQW